MNISQISFYVGLISFLGWITVLLYMTFGDKTTKDDYKYTVRWFVSFCFSLIVLRLLSFYGVGTQEQLRIISSICTVILFLVQIFIIFKKRNNDIMEQQ